MKPKDVTINYLNWLKDREVNKYLEVRFNLPKSIHKLKKEVSTIIKNKSYFLLGIFNNNIHIGNISLDLNLSHKHAKIGIMIGDKNMHRLGFASLSLKLVTNFLFDNLKMRFIYAGIYSNNLSSINLFKKSGFKKVSLFPKFFISKKKLVDEIIMVKWKEHI